MNTGEIIHAQPYTIVLAPSDTVAAIQALAAQATQMVPPQTAAEAESVRHLLVSLQKLKTSITKNTANQLAPLTDTIAQVKLATTNLTMPIEQAQVRLKNLLGAYALEEARMQQAHLDAATTAMQQAPPAGRQTPTIPELPQGERQAKLSTYSHTTVTIDDPALVPHVYCEPSLAKLNAAAAAGATVIPGCTITREIRVRAV